MVLPPTGDTANTNEANHDPEAAPLLVHEHGHRKATPLPLLQLLILAVVRLAEPIGLSQVSNVWTKRSLTPTSYAHIGMQIFPYVNQVGKPAANSLLIVDVGSLQMIEDLGIASPADVGYYSGMIDSAFSFAQLLTVRIIRCLALQNLVLYLWRSVIIDFFLGITFGPDRSQAGDYDGSRGGGAQLCLLWLQ